MSYTYLQEQGEASSGDSFLDICQSAPLNWQTTLGLSCSSGNVTGSCHGSRSGMMSAPSTGDHGAEELMQSAADSHAKTSVSLARGKDSQEQGQVCGKSSPVSSVKSSHLTLSWRTAQPLFAEDSEPSSETWPPSGMMRNGQCWGRMTAAPPMSESEFGSWPTVTARDWKSGAASAQLMAKGGRPLSEVIFWKEGRTHHLNPDWAEWLMGWPVGWSGLGPMSHLEFLGWRRKGRAALTASIQ